MDLGYKVILLLICNLPGISLNNNEMNVVCLYQMFLNFQIFRVFAYNLHT